MRTALLDDINHGRTLQQVEDHRTHKLRKENNQELQERLMQGKFATDPMRLINLADANYQTPQLFGSEIHFAVDRKKKEVLKNGELVQSQAEAQNLYQLLECLAPLRYRSFSSNLTVQDLKGIDTKGTPAKDLRWSIQKIAAACNNFYYPRFKTEMTLLQERAYLNPAWQKTVDAILKGSIFQQIKAGNAFLLRIGRHSGAESVTLNGVRQIKILEGKGADGKLQSSYQSEAKTVWLAAETAADRSNMLPFGWVLVELQDNPNPEVQELLKPWQDKANQTQKQLQKIAERYKAELEKQEATFLPQKTEGYLKLNNRNKSLFLEHSHKILATATTANQIKIIRDSLSVKNLENLDKGQGIKVIAQVINKEIIRIELRK